MFYFLVILVPPRVSFSNLLKRSELVVAVGILETDHNEHLRLPPSPYTPLAKVLVRLV